MDLESIIIEQLQRRNGKCDYQALYLIMKSSEQITNKVFNVAIKRLEKLGLIYQEFNMIYLR